MEIGHYLFMLFAQTCIKDFYQGVACIVRYKQIRALNIKINGTEKHLEICVWLDYKGDLQLLSTMCARTVAQPWCHAEAKRREGI